MFVPNCFKNQKMCDKAVDIYASAIQFVPECYKTQKMCHKDVDACPFKFDSVPDQTQEMRDKAIDADWFVTNKMIKKLDDYLFSNDGVVFGNEDSGNVTFFSDKMGVFCVGVSIIF